jgi:Tfp pilus assembly protein PilO
MSLRIHQQSPGAQVGICVAIALTACGAAWHVLLAPERAEIGLRRDRLAAVQTDVARATTTTHRLPQVRREVDALEAAVLRTSALLPDEQGVRDVQRGLHHLADAANLHINSFTPKASTEGAQFTEWPVELVLEGGFGDVALFFERVAAEPRLIAVANLHLRTNTAPPGANRGVVSATCVASTFVLGKGQ